MILRYLGGCLYFGTYLGKRPILAGDKATPIELGRTEKLLGDFMNAPLDRQQALQPDAISLDDKYTLDRGRVFLTGTITDCP